MYKAYYNSPLGQLLLASDGKNLTGLWFEGQKHYLSNIKQELELKENLDIFNETKIWLDKYFKKACSSRKTGTNYVHGSDKVGVFSFKSK